MNYTEYLPIFIFIVIIRILRNLNGSVLSLLTGGAGNNNYWHWLFDVLPRFGLCSQLINLEKIDFFLLPSLLKKYQGESLDCLKKVSSALLSQHNL